MIFFSLFIKTYKTYTKNSDIKIKYFLEKIIPWYLKYKKLRLGEFQENQMIDFQENPFAEKLREIRKNQSVFRIN